MGFDFQARKNPQGEQAAEKAPHLLSFRAKRGISLSFLGLESKRDPRFARNDKKNRIFRNF